MTKFNASIGKTYNKKTGKTNCCIDCNNKIWINSIRCKSCENIRRYKIYNRKKYYCIDCRKEVSKKKYKRCRECFGLTERGRNYPNCIDCGKELKSYNARRCHSCELKNRWKNSDYSLRVLKHQRKGMKLKPNKPEKLLNKLLHQILFGEYKFVGNGKIFFDRLNPDFINCNGQKKIIELYGDYWHNRKDWKKRDKTRIKIYTKYGYKTLIIWEHELRNLNRVSNKILKFNGVE